MRRVVNACLSKKKPTMYVFYESFPDSYGKRLYRCVRKKSSRMSVAAVNNAKHSNCPLTRNQHIIRTRVSDLYGDTTNVGWMDFQTKSQSSRRTHNRVLRTRSHITRYRRQSRSTGRCVFFWTSFTIICAHAISIRHVAVNRFFSVSKRERKH